MTVILTRTIIVSYTGEIKESMYLSVEFIIERSNLLRLALTLARKILLL